VKVLNLTQSGFPNAVRQIAVLCAAFAIMMSPQVFHTRFPAVTMFGVALLCLQSTPIAGKVIIDTPNSFKPPQVEMLSHVSTPQLNRFTFQGNVLNNSLTEQWVVYYCVGWMGMCSELGRHYNLLAQRHEGVLNAEKLLSPAIRFATVDCAEDKVLCNSQGVDDYPYAVHYFRGKVTSRWASGNGNMESFVKSLRNFVEKSVKNVAKLYAKEAEEAKISAGVKLLMCWLLSFYSGNFLRALVALSMFVSGLGLLLRMARHAAGVTSSGLDKKTTSTESQNDEDEVGDLLTKCIPKEWATDRNSIEL